MTRKAVSFTSSGRLRLLERFGIHHISHPIASHATPERRIPDHRVKLDRANEHLDTLYKAVDAFIAREPYTTVVEYDRQTGENLQRLKAVPVPPQPLSAIVGDVLFNLRSGLDHLIYALASPVRPGRENQVQFPICGSEGFFHEAKQKIGDLPSDSWAIIERLQPYHGGQRKKHFLWLLNDLNRTDKHRLLHLVETFTHGAELVMNQASVNVTFVFAPMPPSGGFVGGAEIARYRLPGNRPDTEMDVQFKLLVDVRFGSGPAKGLPVIGLLDKIRDKVGAVMSELERFL